MGFMKAYENQTYALMRITTGFMFFCHGATKFMNMPDDRPMHIQWIAGPVELIGGALVMIGLMTSPAAFICAGMGAAAYWMGHFSARELPADHESAVTRLRFMHSCSCTSPRRAPASGASARTDFGNWYELKKSPAIAGLFFVSIG